MESIKTTFEEECHGLVIDTKLAKRIAQFQANFRTKNEDHIAFFGGKLIGVHVVRFMDSDSDEWFQDVLGGVDDQLVRERLIALPAVNDKFHVSSDTFNLSCCWLLHALWSSHLDEETKSEAMINVALILQYKFITSLLYHYFKYPADKAVAEATYARLSYKFLIKNFDSWYSLLRFFSERLVAKDGLHRKAIQQMDHDDDVVRMVNDVQSRIRDMVKNIYKEFMNVHKQGIKIHSSSAVVEFDGEEVLRDRVHGLQNYTRYIQSVVPDKGSFIRQELVAIIEKLMGSMNPRLFTECLEWMSANYQRQGVGIIEELLDDTLIHSFTYLQANTTLVRSTHDLPGILSKLRGTYTSSRSTDPTLLALREKAEKVAKLATSNKNSNTLAALRTGLLLYICLRTYTMHYYSQASLLAA
jgi:hypothetical protein